MPGFAVIDFETTGLVPERADRVVEVGVVLLDSAGRREEAWTTLDDAHTALADAEATAQLLARLMELVPASREWDGDLETARSFAWPGSKGRVSAPLARRSAGAARLPSSWMAGVLSDAWVPGVPEDEAAYLVALNNALLDFHVSVTEGRELVEIAQHSGLSRDRVTELHQAHLRRLAAEAWSDGQITAEEHADLNAAALCLGLAEDDVAAALAETRDVRAEPREDFLRPSDRVVFTGTLARERDEWVAEIVAAGLATGGVTKSTRVLVAADPDSLSGKAAKARGYGVPVIGERAFAQYFEQYLAGRQELALGSKDRGLIAQVVTLRQAAGANRDARKNERSAEVPLSN